MTDEEKTPEEGTPQECAPEETPPERGQGAADMVRGVLERISERIDTTAKVARLNLDIGALNSRRTAAFQEMGRKVYDLYGKGLVKNAALAALCADVAEVDAEVAEKRAQIAELRGRRATEEAVEDEDEGGIEEEPPGTAGAHTSSEDLTPEEEEQVRPGQDRRL